LQGSLGTLPSLEKAKSRAPDDRIFLELAVAASADAVVTGDADLLAPTNFKEFGVIAHLKQQ
jgi:predicted nucleic acid-binding protein